MSFVYFILAVFLYMAGFYLSAMLNAMSYNFFEIRSLYLKTKSIQDETKRIKREGLRFQAASIVHNDRERQLCFDIAGIHT